MVLSYTSISFFFPSILNSRSFFPMIFLIFFCFLSMMVSGFSLVFMAFKSFLSFRISLMSLMFSQM